MIINTRAQSLIMSRFPEAVQDVLSTIWVVYLDT